MMKDGEMSKIKIKIPAQSLKVEIPEQEIEMDFQPIWEIDPPVIEKPPIVTPPPSTEKPEGYKSISEFGIESIDKYVEGLKYRGVYFQSETNTNQDGYWTFFEGVPKILRIRNGVENIIEVDYIGKPDFLSQNLADTKIWIDGTYIQLQGNALNTFWYQKTKHIAGGVLIGLNNEGVKRFNRITPNLSDVILHNIIIDNVARTQLNQELTDVDIELNDLQNMLNPITGTDINSSIVLKAVDINSMANIRAGVFIDHAKNVDIVGCSIKAKYADNGIRISEVDEVCIIEDVSTGEGFNTGIQASANRKSLSIGYKFNGNTIINVLEEGLGFDSYANNLGLIPVIAKSKVISSLENKVKLGDLIFAEKVDGVYKHKKVSPSDITSPKNCVLINEANYKVIEIIDYRIEGDSFVLDLTDSIDVGIEVALVTGFYNCEISNNTIFGKIPESSTQPAHAISMWGGGYYNKISNNVINGGRSGLSFSSLGGFGLTSPDFFCHAIGNVIDSNRFNNLQYPFRLTSEYSTKKGFGNKFINNFVDGGEFLINNQIDFEATGNEFKQNKGLIESVSGKFEGNTLIDTIIEIKNCPDLIVGQNTLIGSSKIDRS